jgi:hypothetical protein
MSLAVTLLFLGCSRSDSPERLQQRAKALGVYVYADGDLHAVSSYMIEEVAAKFLFVSPTAIPKFRNVHYFVVNFPKAVIEDSNVLWVTDLRALRVQGSESSYIFASYNSKYFDVKGITIEPLPGGLYKIVPTGLQNGQPGWLCLLLRMPPGSPNRMYLVEVSPSGQ